MEKPSEETIRDIAKGIADSQYGGYEDGYYDFISGIIEGINYVYDVIEKEKL